MKETRVDPDRTSVPPPASSPQATTSLITGLVALLAAPVPLLSLATPLAATFAIVFGILALRRRRSAKAVVGIAAGVLALAVVAAIAVYLAP